MQPRTSSVTFRKHVFLLLFSYLFGLLFDPEEGGSTVLRNVSELISDRTASHTRRDRFRVTLLFKHIVQLIVWSTEISREPNSCSAGQEIPAFCRTVSTRSYPEPHEFSPILPMLYYPPSTPRPPNISLSLHIFRLKLVCVTHLDVCYMPRPSYPP
jgi:hypothetical protein